MTFKNRSNYVIWRYPTYCEMTKNDVQMIKNEIQMVKNDVQLIKNDVQMI